MGIWSIRYLARTSIPWANCCIGCSRVAWMIGTNRSMTLTIASFLTSRFSAASMRRPGQSTIDRCNAGAFADEIVSQTVRYQPTDRAQTANELASKVRRLIARFEAGGRALDLRLPQRCLFCGTGGYQPLETLPPIEQRLASPDPTTLPSPHPD